MFGIDEKKATSANSASLSAQYGPATVQMAPPSSFKSYVWEPELVFSNQTATVTHTLSSPSLLQAQGYNNAYWGEDKAAIVTVTDPYHGTTVHDMTVGTVGHPVHTVDIWI